MCHYELARDRPEPAVPDRVLPADVGRRRCSAASSTRSSRRSIFVHAYEYKLVLIIACLMVPKLTEDRGDGEAEDDAEAWTSMGVSEPARVRGRLSSTVDKLACWPSSTSIPVLLGVAFYYLSKLPDESEWFAKFVNSLHERLSLSQQTIDAVLIYAVPVMLCFFFVDRPFRFALCVAAHLGPITPIDESTESDDLTPSGVSSAFSRSSRCGALQPPRPRHDASRHADQRAVRPALRRRHPDARPDRWARGTDRRRRARTRRSTRGRNR